MWEISPDRLVAGTTAHIQLRYVNGPRALPAGSAHIVHFEPISVADLFHAQPSEAVELVLEGDEPPHVEVEPMKIAGIGYGEVVLRFPAGLEAGAHFALDYGNRQPDGTIAALVAPIHMRGLTFEIFTQLEQDGPRSSWLNTSWLEGLPTVDLVADVPSRVRLFGPTLVGTGTAFRLRLAVTDAYDSRSEPPFAGAIALEAPPGLLGLPGQLERTAGDASVGAIEGLSLPRARHLPRSRAAARRWRVVREQPDRRAGRRHRGRVLGLPPQPHALLRVLGRRPRHDLPPRARRGGVRLLRHLGPLRADAARPGPLGPDDVARAPLHARARRLGRQRPGRLDVSTRRAASRR
jgi:hypothetical protein